MMRDNRGRGVPILAYHRISGAGSVIDTPVGVFLETMHRLIDAGWRCINVSEWIEAGCPELEQAFGITFDDGDQTILDVISEFSRLKLTATVFLVTDHVGAFNNWPGQPRWAPLSRLLDWSEIKELHRLGITFGSHTKTHPDLRKLAAPTLDHELLGSREAIENQLGTRCSLLAYPYGHYCQPVYRRAGEIYLASFGTRQGLACSESPAHALSRIDAHYLKKGQLLEHLIKGDAQHWLFRRNRLRIARRIMRLGVPG